MCAPDSLSKGLFYGRATMTKDTQPRRRVDWDAVERDYRTGQFTEQELADKHGATRSAVSKQKRVKGWTKDLQSEIRQATNARLVAELVANEVAKGSEKVADTVLVAAEVNTQVILKHRSKLSDLHDLVEVAKAKLEEVGGALVDVKEVATFVQAVGNLATSTKTLIEQERKAFGLDETSEKKTDLIEDLILEALNGQKANH